MISILLIILITEYEFGLPNEQNMRPASDYLDERIAPSATQTMDSRRRVSQYANEAAMHLEDSIATMFNKPRIPGRLQPAIEGGFLCGAEKCLDKGTSSSLRGNKDKQSSEASLAP
ncbi:hypothetical protein ETB97_001725 [Aspergillus alliaceus]|uniref:Uncharacterized protein n=1 Tax=Petromyces alliaceus TaxID=209559 RepID=A0A8H6A488_PETAA|nr:hypothetical protein ETB97_001725 [Aspergillus burnettii]